MRLDIGSVRYDVGAVLTADLSPEWTDLDYGDDKIPFCQPITVQVTATNTGEMLLVQGSVQTAVVLACSRCLETVELPVVGEFAVGYREPAQTISETGGEQLDVRPLSSDEIDLSADILGTISLAIPMKPLCALSCQGLCSVCGNNLNVKECNCFTEKIDPRLAVLKEWINK